MLAMVMPSEADSSARSRSSNSCSAQRLSEVSRTMKMA
jgi:hypothetical protein